MSRRRRDGYGELSLGGVAWRAHRLAWTLNFGPIPPGMVVMHVCDKPACVEPSHLSLGTQQSNQLDKVRKRRHATLAGHGRAKLTLADVRKIRRRLTAGDPKMHIAADFGVSAKAIYQIAKGITWKEAS